MNDSSMVISIKKDDDVVAVRQAGRRLAQDLGFGLADQTRLVTAISELARNIIYYAGHGQATLRQIASGIQPGIEVILEDEGPGIVNVELAMQDGFSSRTGSLGAGLPGARRLAHEFHLKTREEINGTSVTIRMWLR